MAPRTDIKITETPDGRILVSKLHLDGPKAETYPVPGELGALLREAGYSAEIVVRRLDGGAIVQGDRDFIGDAMRAAQEHGTHSPQVRERAAAGHFAQLRPRAVGPGGGRARAAGGRGRPRAAHHHRVRPPLGEGAHARHGGAGAAPGGEPHRDARDRRDGPDRGRAPRRRDLGQGAATEALDEGRHARAGDGARRSGAPVEDVRRGAVRRAREVQPRRRAPEGRGPAAHRQGPRRAAGVALHARGGRVAHQRHARAAGPARALHGALPRGPPGRRGRSAPLARLEPVAPPARVPHGRSGPRRAGPLTGEADQDRSGAGGAGAHHAGRRPRRVEAPRVGPAHQGRACARG